MQWQIKGDKLSVVVVTVSLVLAGFCGTAQAQESPLAGLPPGVAADMLSGMPPSVQAAILDPQGAGMPSPPQIRMGPGATANPYSYALNNPYKYTDPTGLDVTLRLYQGAGPFGHIGLGVAPHGQTIAPGQTLGFYPATSNLGALLGGTPGILRQDTGALLYPGGANTIVIPTTPEQDAAITAYLQYLRSHGEYALASGGAAENCTTAAEHALSAGGVSTPNTIVPYLLMHSLQTKYGGN